MMKQSKYLTVLGSQGRGWRGGEGGRGGGGRGVDNLKHTFLIEKEFKQRPSLFKKTKTNNSSHRVIKLCQFMSDKIPIDFENSL